MSEQEAQLMLTTGSTRLAVSRGQQTWYHSTCYIYTVFQKNPCDYVFDDNLNSKRPILLIFGTVIT